MNVDRLVVGGVHFRSRHEGQVSLAVRVSVLLEWDCVPSEDARLPINGQVILKIEGGAGAKRNRSIELELKKTKFGTMKSIQTQVT